MKQEDAGITNSLSLKEYFDEKIKVYGDSIKNTLDEREKLSDIRFKASETAVSAALLAQKELVSAAFLASEKAIVKAEDAQKDYNIRSNEFRGQLDDQAKTLMPRPEFHSIQSNNEKILEGIVREIAGLRESRAAIEAKATMSSVYIAYVISIVGLLASLYGIFR